MSLWKSRPKCGPTNFVKFNTYLVLWKKVHSPRIWATFVIIMRLYKESNRPIKLAQSGLPAYNQILVVQQQFDWMLCSFGGTTQFDWMTEKIVIFCKWALKSRFYKHFEYALAAWSSGIFYACHRGDWSYGYTPPGYRVVAFLKKKTKKFEYSVVKFKQETKN
jgi:hypothetical protein